MKKLLMITLVVGMLAAAPSAAEEIEWPEKVKEGVYEIGVDIPAGDYVVFPDTSLLPEGLDMYFEGYYFITEEKEGHDYIDSMSFASNAIAHCPEGAWLELKFSYAIPLALDPEVDVTGDGFFLVGHHIPAGEYDLEPTMDLYDGYYFIYPDPADRHTYAGVDNFKDTAHITVEDGQLLRLDRARIIWPE